MLRAMTGRPDLTLILKRDAAKAVAAGKPWVFKGDIEWSSACDIAEPGTLVMLADPKMTPMAVGYLNPHSNLAVRVLSTNPKTLIDDRWFEDKFARALKKREKLFDAPFYRLVHAEGDGLPGLVIDRYGDILVAQVTTAGMEWLTPVWLPVIDRLLSPATIVMDLSASARLSEGLELEKAMIGKPIEGEIDVPENGVIYRADVVEGQKTGWYFDQRANRCTVMERAAGKSMLDLYAHTGAFGLAAAKAGAREVTIVDRSAPAIDKAGEAAERNGLAHLCTFEVAEAYDWLDEAAAKGRTFEIVSADPPPFIKNRAMKAAGMAGYEKLAVKLGPVIAKGGILAFAACSHHASPGALKKAITGGLAKAGRKATLVHEAGADKDHPVHPQLPETRYLTFLMFEID